MQSQLQWNKSESLFFGEKYKQYLTFSVEITTNILLNSYGENRWSDKQEHKHKRIKSHHDSVKGCRTITKLLNVDNSSIFSIISIELALIKKNQKLKPNILLI